MVYLRESDGGVVELQLCSDRGPEPNVTVLYSHKHSFGICIENKMSLNGIHVANDTGCVYDIVRISRFAIPSRTTSSL